MDVGVQFGQYDVVEHIGRGGMADVWSARDKRLNRMVAVKTVATGLSQETDPVALFEREARTIARLEHPHILPIYDFGEFEGQLYIVMRYVTGGSLEDMLERGPMPVKDVLQMGQSIAQALDYAHSNKVIHLDLKPPNILLDSHSSPYLADFGLATMLDPEGRAANPGSGTLLYMAPEQMTADVLDHRADIYSFALVLFHMLTGQLPFDATIPLALKQLQYQDELPNVDDINPDLPTYLTDVLRRGTSVLADSRPPTMGELIEDMRDVLGEATAFAVAVDGDYGEYPVSDIDPASMMTEQIIGMGDAALLEAVDLYSRARHAWAGGQGRFLLGVTHFMLMNDYYMEAERHGLELDESGMQVFLRGALEYDQGIAYWWNLLDDANRRWVCLHAIRSENAPARIRALYRLETLPDDEKRPQIPKLVAQALQVEINEPARLAALQVLGTRARLLKHDQDYQIQTEYQGRLLTSMTRMGIQLRPPSVWQEAVYSPEIDLLIAETALDQGMPRVAEFAARIIGRMRSTTAVRHIAIQQHEGRPGALRALALIRDEAPSLPSLVSRQARLYAWLYNSWRRLSHNPMGIVWRYIFAVLGGGIAMGAQVFITFRSQAIFTPQRWGNTIAIGLTFGVLIGFLVLLADEFSGRLRGFWPWWTRLLLSAFLGFLWGTLTWGAYTWLFLQQNPEWDLMRFAGGGLAFGFVLAAMINLRGWVSFLVTVIATYIPLYLAFRDFWFQETPVSSSRLAVLFYDDPNQILTLAIPVAILIALGSHAPAISRDVLVIVRRLRGERVPSRPGVIPAPQSAAASVQAPARPAGGRPDLSTQLDIGTEPRRLVETEPDVVAAVPGVETEPDLGLMAPPLETERDVIADVSPRSIATELDAGAVASPLEVETELDAGAPSVDTKPDLGVGALHLETEPDVRADVRPPAETELDPRTRFDDDEDDDQ